ncbi:hypothetical protein GPECTOR_56g446 [Gonium pectorale]|uniref:Protein DETOXIFICATION n=1 Tax=Gonium pectorale TaxID=33097 RepID=A0A150G641_GONPE|nr:hypothetical protein GPECTOR_56g446 [Gonium pectorale]|eukprot:KXZ45349.1 hypothetical protein GPECTOR_56g446 [Gonium pectorale]
MDLPSGEVLSPRGNVHSASCLAAPFLPAAEAADNEDAGDAKQPEALGELGRLSRLAGPLILQNLAGYSLSIVSAAFLGHLNDPVALSSAVLAGSFYNITGYSLVIGLAAGMETLCGQAYGAGNYGMLGLVLQRALLICWVACLPVAAFWSQSRWLLAALHQQPEIVDGASRYLAIATPALFLSVISSCLYRYLVTQQEVRPSTICTVITALLCPAFNWALIYKLRMGLEGAAWAFVASTGTYSALLAAYTLVRDWRLCAARSPRATWGGLSAGAFEGWGTYLRFALPSAAMICMEWWIFELVILMSGTLGSFADVAVASMGISFNISSWCYMIPMALGTAANTRVANALGAGSAARAATSARTALGVALGLQLCLAGGLFAGRHHVAKVFTLQPDVVHNVGRLMPALAASVLGDGVIAVLGGILRGSGRQSLGAALNLVGYWAVGCPVALLLGFRAHMDVLGFWCGLASATSLQTMILGTVVLRCDWRREVRRAAVLVSEQADQAAIEQDRRRSRGYARPEPDEEAAGNGAAGQHQHQQRPAAVRVVARPGPGEGEAAAPAALANSASGSVRDVEALVAAGGGAADADDIRTPLLAAPAPGAR